MMKELMQNPIFLAGKSEIADERRFTCRARPARHIDGAQRNLCRYGGEYDRREKTHHRVS